MGDRLESASLCAHQVRSALTYQIDWCTECGAYQNERGGEWVTPLGARRRESASSENEERLRSALRAARDALHEANEMVCKHSMPYGWPAFQVRLSLPDAAEVLRVANVPPQSTEKK